MADRSDALPSDAQFHHVGYATASIEREQKVLMSLGYIQEGPPFEDPVQGVAGRFLVGAGPRIELLEPLPGSATLIPWLNAGVKMYHLAYEVEDVRAATEWARAQRARITVDCMPAVAFGGRRISFAMMRNGLLIELIGKHLSPET